MEKRSQPHGYLNPGPADTVHSSPNTASSMQSFLQYRKSKLRLQRQNEHCQSGVPSGPSYMHPDIKSSRPGHSATKEKDLEEGRASPALSPEVVLDETSNTLSIESTAESQPHSQNMRAPKQLQADTGHAEDLIIVRFDEGDDLNPHNWSFGRKCVTTLLLLGAGVVGGWASANDSTIIPQAKISFGVSDVTESLATGLYLVAFGVGSLVSGPFSETVGRNPVYIITLVLFMIFVMASGLAPNIGSQLTFRFLAGLFGCTAVTTFAGTVADLWAPNERTLILTLGSVVNFTGVFLSPCVGAFIGQSATLDWRWTEWITLILTGAVACLIIFLAPETYGPVILSWKATHMRSLTGDMRYRSEHELKLEPLMSRLWRSVWRPFDMFLHEIIVVLFTAYLTVLYIVSFTFLTGYTYIYGDIYGFSQGSIGLCFLGLAVGILLGGAIGVPLHFKYVRDLQKAKENGKQSLPPESRLLFIMISAPCLPIGLFWMAWTSNASISYWSSLAGSTLIGVSFLGIFIGTYLYLIDTFEAYAASALSIATFARYVAAGAMIPVSIPMYENLGVQWTMTVLGCISLVLTPLPFVFYRYGDWIRGKSRNSRDT